MKNKIIILICTVLALAGCGVSHKTTDKPVTFVRQNGLSKTEQETFNATFLEAVRQQLAENHDVAYELLTQCLEMDPEAPEALFRMAQYQIEMRQDSLAILLLKKAVEGDPTNTHYLETLALDMTYKNNLEEATKYYEQLLKISPNNAEALNMLMRIYSQRQDYDNAIATLNRLEVLEGTNERMTMAKVDLLTRQNKKQEAQAELEQLAAKYPNDLNFKVLMADWKMNNDMKAEGFQELQSVLTTEPDNKDAQVAMLNYYIGENNERLVWKQIHEILINPKTDQKTTIELARFAVSRNEANPDADSTQVLNMFDETLKARQQEDGTLLMLYASYMELKNMPLEGIDSILREVLVVEPDNASARVQLLSHVWEKADWQEATKLCKQGQQYDPEELVFYYYEALAQHQIENDSEALAILQRSTRAINAESTASVASDIYDFMGMLLHESGRNEEAYAAYDSCLQYKEDNISCLNNYAYYLSEDNRELQKAEQMSYKAIKAEPENGNYLDTYAWILYQQGRYEESKIYIDEALKHIDPEGDNSTIEKHAKAIEKALKKTKKTK